MMSQDIINYIKDKKVAESNSHFFVGKNQIIRQVLLAHSHFHPTLAL